MAQPVDSNQPLPLTPTAALRRIVVGTDFSDAASVALQAAIDLAAAHGASLTIVHAVDPMVAAMDISPQIIIDDTRKALERVVAPIRSRKIAVEASMRMSKPWWAIEEAAKESQADLVVLASHGRSGLAKVALGSTADRVLRTCGVPVLMIPVNRSGAAMGDAPSQWKSAVVGIDFSQESLLAANMAARLLNGSQVAKASLTLFHTVALTIEFRGPDVPVALPRHWDDMEGESKTQLDALASSVRSSKVDVRTVTFRGYPSDGILREARTAKANVIALGTHGRGAVNRMLLGSVAERVLHHAECPVLTVRHAPAE